MASVLNEDFEKKRWAELDKLILRPGPFAHPSFSPGPDVKNFLQTCKILVVGAGGLGCDLVKNLALSGFKNIHIIDMDTIDTSNLNRQFLFRDKDVGASKSITAANFVNKRVPGVNVTAHYCAIQDMKLDFYKSFNIVICGLDSVDARRWVNSTLFDFVKFEEDGNVDWSTVIPYIDGGTEGFKGQARVILPGVSACFECTMDLFTADENFPLCTIKNKPRLPEHCIQYALLVLWDQAKNKPGIPDGERVDGDNPKHIKWIYDTALDRAQQFNIRGVTYRLSQGVIKRIIPAIASTNAIVASACTNEALKLATLMATSLDDYAFYNGNEGIFTYTFKYEKKKECAVCGQPYLTMSFSKNAPIKALRKAFNKNPSMKLRNTTIRKLSGDYIYAATPKNLEAMTAPNLDKLVGELISDGETLLVTDRNTINCEFRVTLKLTDEPFADQADDE